VVDSLHVDPASRQRAAPAVGEYVTRTLKTQAFRQI
jgi:hypothetical protein